MKQFVQKYNSTILVLGILFLGIGFLPFVEASPLPLGWQQFIGVYESDLDVDVNKGAPGSIFTFHGSSYPADSVAIIFIDGIPLGTVTTNTEGEATFLISSNGLDLGEHMVTMEVHSNATASKTVELDNSEPVVPPMPGNEDPVFDITLIKFIYLPIISK